ncbi:MAG: hypothetical protein ABSB24_05335, partial [Gaiellaceae bacterium]
MNALRHPLRRSRRWRVAAAVVVVGVIAFAIVQFVGSGSNTTPVPKFVARALGPTQPLTASAKDLGVGTHMSLGRSGGLTVSQAAAHVSLTSSDSAGGTWQQHRGGAVRSTPFGSEVVVATHGQAEQFLTVGKHYGTRTWTWRLSSNLGYPRVGDDGYVAFIKSHVLSQKLFVKPVQIFDANHHVITPKGLTWSLAEDGAGRWFLQLTLDDSKLPVPYVIDPAIAFRVAMSGNSGTGGTVTTFTVPTNVGVAAGDLLLATVSFGLNTITGVGVKGSNAAATAYTLLATSTARLQAFGKIADANDTQAISPNITATWTTATGGAMIVTDFTGVAATNYADVINRTATSLTPVSITPDQDSELLVEAYQNNYTNGFTGTVSAPWNQPVAGGVFANPPFATSDTAVNQVYQIMNSATAGAAVTPPTETVANSNNPHSLGLSIRIADAAAPVLSNFIVATNNTLTFTEADGAANQSSGPAQVVPLPTAFTVHYLPDGGSLQNLQPTTVVAGAQATNSRTVTLTMSGTPFTAAGVVTLDYTAPGSTTTTVAFTTASGTQFTLASSASFPASGKVVVTGATSSGSPATAAYTFSYTGNAANVLTGVTGWPIGAPTTINSGATVKTGLLDENGNAVSTFAGQAVTFNPPDGSGTLSLNPANVSASSTVASIQDIYNVPSGGLTNGEVDFIIPAGWTAPITGAGAGHVSVSTGTIGTITGGGPWTVPVTGITIASGQVTLTYATVTVPAGTGTASFTGKEKTLVGGTLTNLASGATMTINAADGTGTLTTPTANVANGATGQTITFTYTAATGGISNGEVDITVPTGWTTPTTA